MKKYLLYCLFLTFVGCTPSNKPEQTSADFSIEKAADTLMGMPHTEFYVDKNEVNIRFKDGTFFSYKNYYDIAPEVQILIHDVKIFNKIKEILTINHILFRQEARIYGLTIYGIYYDKWFFPAYAQQGHTYTSYLPDLTVLNYAPVPGTNCGIVMHKGDTLIFTAK